MSGHVPVLLRDVLDQLQLSPNDPVIDATWGGGGHTRALLAANAPHGRLLAIEADPRTFTTTETSFADVGDRLVPVHGNFRRLAAIVRQRRFPPAAGVLLDLGLSSLALADPARGFSFQHDGPLDMRLDPTTQTMTAADLVNRRPAAQLVEILQSYGEERAARTIAAALVAARRNGPITTTTELADLLSRTLRRRGRIHPATKTFQALRIAVNDELGALRDVLPQALSVLRPGGRLAVIAFHSLEDRLVKRWAKLEASAGRLTIVTKHPIRPSFTERRQNPRGRSAKLRVLAKPIPST